MKAKVGLTPLSPLITGGGGEGNEIGLCFLHPLFASSICAVPQNCMHCKSHWRIILRWKSWKYNFVEVSGNNLDISQNLRFIPSFLSLYEIFYFEQTWVFFIDFSPCIDFSALRWYLMVSVRFSSFRCVSNYCFYREKMYLYINNE